MPDPISWIATAVGNFLVSIGVPQAAAMAIGTAAATVAQTLVYVGLAIATAPDIPHPERGKQNFKQSVAPRRRGYGLDVRIAGIYALYHAEKGVAYLSTACHHGRIQAVNAYYMHDDLVTLHTVGGKTYVDGEEEGLYGNEKIMVRARLGEDTGTAWSEFTSRIPTIWTSTHRGDRIAGLDVMVKRAKDSLQAEIFPNGLVEPSFAGALSPVWDWRDVGQDEGDDSTWEATNNPVVNLRDFICGATDDGCMGEDYDRRIAPSLSYWTAAADDCDDTIAKVGGTEAKYECGGFYDFDNHPADVMGEMLRSFDGWMAEAGDGSLIVRSGVYYTPTITFDDDHVIDYSLRRFLPDEEAVNELIIKYVDPASAHTLVETDPWRDEADVANRGVVRTEPLEMRWVQRKTQARRLAKRHMSRAQAQRGTFVTNLYGLRGLGERYVGLNISEIAALTNIVVEVVKVEIDLAARRLTWTWIEADPNIDDWDPATEEGNAPSTSPPTPAADGTPEIVDEYVNYVETAPGVYTPRAQLFVTDPSREDDIQWRVRWRKSGETAWTVEAPQDSQDDNSSPATGLYVLTGFLPVNATIQAQVAWVFGNGADSAWSATHSFSTSTDGAGEGPPAIPWPPQPPPDPYDPSPPDTNPN